MNIRRFLLILLSLSQISLYAQYGKQFDNRGFEQWTTRKSVSEPTHWHSGGTATGTFSGFVSSQIETSSQTRPGSSGSKSVRLYPTKVLGITANGNLTNGRMNAGSMSASGSGNYNYTQRSNEAFNTPIDIIPDSLAVWVCFRSESATQNAEIHATVHGDADYKLIANGTEEPIDKLVATARKSFTRTAPANGNYQWQRLSIPFEKNGTCNDVRYLLFTITTNAIPGEGSDRDDLFVDDILLIYNPSLRLEQLAKTHFEVGENIEIPFTLNGTMSADNLNSEANQVVAQLSNANGDFSNPIELGRITTNESGTITAQIPDLGPTANYKVRVISTNYQMVGGNVQEIEIIGDLGLDENGFTFCNIYPNPTHSSISILSSSDIMEVRLLDLKGSTLLQQTISNGKEIMVDLSDFGNGVYVLQVFNKQGCNTKQIIKL